MASREHVSAGQVVLRLLREAIRGANSLKQPPEEEIGARFRYSQIGIEAQVDLAMPHGAPGLRQRVAPVRRSSMMQFIMMQSHQGRRL